MKGGGGGGEWILSRSVSFTDYLAGYPLTGVGSKISVTVGAGGAIGGFRLPWREYIHLGNVSIITPQEAYGRLNRGEWLEGPKLMEGDVYIKEVYMAYYIPSLFENPGEIIPCYVFEGKLEDGEYVQFTISAVS